MLLRISLLCCLALLVTADNSIDYLTDRASAPNATRVEHSVSFETSHKRAVNDDTFQTAHKIPLHALPNEAELDLQDFKNLQGAMSLLPTKERPELNPVLSALINEDVMKSIEAKRAIEQEELELIKAEADAAVKREEAQKANVGSGEAFTEAAIAVLTTAKPVKKTDLDEENDINVGFVDQAINLDAAGSENNKKSRIEIKKGPNGQDYEYEYVYYYEDEDDDSKAKTDSAVKQEQSERGKSRYSNIERSTAATPTGNSLVSNKAKGRSSSVDESNVEPERLPTNTRFPSRGKNMEAQPTPALDSLENAAEKKKISVKRPSLELVDSETFNTDEKQAKGIRNGDTEAKPATAIEQEQSQLTGSNKSADEPKDNKMPTIGSEEENITERNEDDGVEQTTLSMEKAALDLYAILANENFNMDMTTDADMDVTTTLPDTTNSDDSDTLTTLQEEELTSTTTTSTTTTTTEAPTTTTTTTTTTPAPLFGGRRAGLASPGRNRFKLKQGGTSATTTTTTETPTPAEPNPKSTKNRFSRPPIGGRNRPGAKTTTTNAPPATEEEEVAVKEVKPVSSSFGRGRPRNRFNIRSTTTTEKSVEDSEDENPEAVPSTTARATRGRPSLGLRGRSRTTTSKPSATTDTESSDNEANAEEKPTPAHSGPARPTRFGLNRASNNRLLPRGKLGRTTEAPASDDSTADSSHYSDVKGEDEEEGEKTNAEGKGATPHAAAGLNRLKPRGRLDTLHKTDNVKPKVAASVTPRKVNPLLAKRRLHLGPSTTESAVEEDASTASEEPESKDEPASTDDTSSTKDDTSDSVETTTKQQARGLGLLGQRRRLPLRKPGTIL